MASSVKEIRWHEDLIQAGSETYILRWYENHEYFSYMYRVKMDNGQYVNMEIYAFNAGKKYRGWTVILSVPSKKKKGYEFRKQTGRNGITSLLIAKEIIKYHTENVIKKDKSRDHLFYIGWDDKAREKAYTRGLSDLGFVIHDNCFLEGVNYGRRLVKVIKNI